MKHLLSLSLILFSFSSFCFGQSSGEPSRDQPIANKINGIITGELKSLNQLNAEQLSQQLYTIKDPTLRIILEDFVDGLTYLKGDRLKNRIVADAVLLYRVQYFKDLIRLEKTRLADALLPEEEPSLRQQVTKYIKDFFGYEQQKLGSEYFTEDIELLGYYALYLALVTFQLEEKSCDPNCFEMQKVINGLGISLQKSKNLVNRHLKVIVSPAVFKVLNAKNFYKAFSETITFTELINKDVVQKAFGGIKTYQICINCFFDEKMLHIFTDIQGFTQRMEVRREGEIQLELTTLDVENYVPYVNKKTRAVFGRSISGLYMAIGAHGLTFTRGQAVKVFGESDDLPLAALIYLYKIGGKHRAGNNSYYNYYVGKLFLNDQIGETTDLFKSYLNKTTVYGLEYGVYLSDTLEFNVGVNHFKPYSDTSPFSSVQANFSIPLRHVTHLLMDE